VTRERRRVRPSATDTQQRTESGLKLPRLTGGMQVTQRAVALLVVVGLMVISYVGSMRIYLDQQNDMSTARVQIAERQATIAQLEDELARWNDPNYIKTQARERLGWVLPGEVGYRVIGTDGTVVSGQVGSIQGSTDPEKQAWYERIWSSVQAADQPAVAAPTTTPVATVTPPAPAPSASSTKKR
jgi:cell division protein FtsB